MVDSGNLSVTPHGDREIMIIRVFPARRDAVFEASTNPELVRKWLLGPPGWEMPTCDVDLSVGGRFRYVWRSTDGKNIGMGGEFREIARPERILHTELFDEDWTGGETLVTTTFVESDDKTTLTLKVLYSSAAARDAVLKSAMADGLAQSYDQLEELLSNPIE